MLCYIYDCNYIKVVGPHRNGSKDSIHQELTVKVFKPKLQTFNNEASTALNNFFTINNIAYQLVPPHFHRRNAAEHTIRTFKEHVVAGISSVDPSFPMHLWDRILQQAEITLSLMRTSHMHPQLSAATHCHGLVDYSKTAFAPPGCKIISDKKPGKRRAWAPQGQHIYSLGPAMHHYRCQNVYILTTASESIVDNATAIIHRPVSDGSERHDGRLLESSSRLSLCQRRG
jgi:hypothetical protein